MRRLIVWGGVLAAIVAGAIFEAGAQSWRTDKFFLYLATPPDTSDYQDLNLGATASDTLRLVRYLATQVGAPGDTLGVGDWYFCLTNQKLIRRTYLNTNATPQIDTIDANVAFVDDRRVIDSVIVTGAGVASSVRHKLSGHVYWWLIR